jgi:hypothetical protein
MKRVKFFVTTIILFAAVTVNAESFGLEAGYGNSSTFVGEGDTLNTLNGFHIGPTAELQIQGPLSLQYGLFYNFLTSSKTYENSLVDTKISTTFHSIDIPVRLAFTVPAGNNVGVFIFGGPSFNIGISKKSTGKVISGLGTLEIPTIDYYKTDDEGNSMQSRFDIQMGVGAAIKVNGVQLRVGYDWGLLDTNNSENYTLTRDEFKASIGFDL